MSDTHSMRYAIVTDHHRLQTLFSAVGLTDSEFLHEILCDMYPTVDYTVRFTNRRPVKSANREWFGGDDSSGLPNYSARK